MAAITVFIMLTFAQYDTKTIPTEVRYIYRMTRCLVHNINTHIAVTIPMGKEIYVNILFSINSLTILNIFIMALLDYINDKDYMKGG
jgi:hypothetical protein